MSARGTLLLVEKCSHCISWYDIESGKRVHSVALPSFPHEFVTDRADRYAWVGHYGVETSGHVGAATRCCRSISPPAYWRERSISRRSIGSMVCRWTSRIACTR